MKYSDKKTIGFLGYSPASVNSLYPIFLELDKLNIFNLKLYSLSDFAINVWGGSRIEFNDIDFSELDFIFYNTGSGHEIETKIPKICKEHGVVSIHILDIFWSTMEGYKKRFKYVPNFTTCVTSINQKDIISITGLPESRVLPLGNPHFDRLKEYGILDGNIKNKTIKSISFISQCGTGGTLNEPTADMCKEALLQLSEMKKQGLIKELKIFKHPRENLEFFIENDLAIQGENSFDSMLDCDVMISCGSTPQYEANVIGKPTITFEDGTDLFDKISCMDFDRPIVLDVDKFASESIVNWFLDIANIE